MIEKIIDSFRLHVERNAFFIKDNYFSYGQVAQKVSDIRKLFKKHIPDLNPKFIGVMINDDLESYCSCISVLLSGCGYVPLNPLNPVERNLEIIVQSNLKIILSSEGNIESQFKLAQLVIFILTTDLSSSPVDLDFPICREEDPAYVIFTSGSTGKPKGTPISRENLNAFLDSVWHLGWRINQEDRFLQMSSMTFDMSIITFIIPLCVGACIYTVPEDEIKYLYGYKLMRRMDISFIAVVPSTISYLEPYFDEIDLPKIKYSLVCGEAFPIELAKKWEKCTPNAKIFNIYGPTEATVFTHTYVFQSGSYEKSHNGVMALGMMVKNMKGLIVNEKMEAIESGRQGELLLAGSQLTAGYLNEAERNRQAFIVIAGERYYKTGDIVYKDNDNDFYFVGRIDQQVKIQGHRVELGEIEMHARGFLNGTAAVAVARKNEFGNHHVELFIETTRADQKEIMDFMKTKLPYYMLPAKMYLLEKFPLNQNGKIDRQALINGV